MRTRHRPPSIFNLSMVDVLCCALGCMVLLWLLNLREARQKSLQAGQTGEQLQAALAERDQARQELTAATSRVASLERDLRLRQEDIDDALGQLKLTRKRLGDAEDEVRKTSLALEQTRGERDADRKKLADLGKQIETLRFERDDVQEKLSKSALAYSGLDRKLVATSKEVADLESRLREKEALADVSGRQAKDLAEKLTMAGDRSRSVQ
jgi:chromosome segregation ATPase